MLKVRVKKKQNKENSKSFRVPIERIQELEVQTPTSKNCKLQNSVKKWLSNNKIYFDTLMTLALTVMGVCISLVSCQYEKRAVEIQKAESIVTEQLNMPIFNISKDYYDEYIENGIIYPTGQKVCVINNGGNISEAYLDAEYKIQLVVLDENYDQVAVVALEDTSRYNKSFSYYDARSKSFTIMIESTPRDLDLRYFIDEQLAADYSKYHITMLNCDYFHIQYHDFKNEFHSEWYALSNGDLINWSPIDTNKQDAVHFESMSNQDIYNRLKEMLEEVLVVDDSIEGT